MIPEGYCDEEYKRIHDLEDEVSRLREALANHRLAHAHFTEEGFFNLQAKLTRLTDAAKPFVWLNATGWLDEVARLRAVLKGTPGT